MEEYEGRKRGVTWSKVFRSTRLFSLVVEPLFESGNINIESWSSFPRNELTFIALLALLMEHIYVSTMENSASARSLALARYHKHAFMDVTPLKWYWDKWHARGDIKSIGGNTSLVLSLKLEDIQDAIEGWQRGMIIAWTNIRIEPTSVLWLRRIFMPKSELKIYHNYCSLIVPPV